MPWHSYNTVTMNMKHAIFFLLLCTFQLSVAGEPKCWYDDCKKNPKKASDDYAQKHKEYMAYVAELRLKHMALIDKPLSQMRTDPDCIEESYRSFNSLDFTYLGYMVCGIWPLRHNYDPPSKDSKIEDEICKFFEVKGAIAVYLMPKNTKIRQTCRPDEWFKKIFYNAWKECHERKCS